ncbi:hypothetical protein BC828DRAFT_91173 [Blastocladiella britannica]|nr:hypothetical protein BC828DRAFT_91173 [Blastocladiella britannica]
MRAALGSPCRLLRPSTMRHSIGAFPTRPPPRPLVELTGTGRRSVSSTVPRLVAATPHALHVKPHPPPPAQQSLTSLAFTESALSVIDIANLRPTSTAVPLTARQYDQLAASLDRGFTKALLVEYIAAEGSHAALSPYLPGSGSVGLTAKSRVTKPVLVRAILRGIWGVKVAPPPSSALATTATNATAAATAEGNETVALPNISASAVTEGNDIMARVRAIPDQAAGSLEVPCTPRDLFFIHGHGETADALMLQGGVEITLDTKKQMVRITGSGSGIKKTVGLMRGMLQYKEATMHIAPVAQQSPLALAVAKHFITLIMRKCNVYMEERAEPSSTGPHQRSQLHITATSLVSLAQAKQLVRSVWDMLQDTRWHMVGAVSRAPAHATGGTYAMVPVAEPHWGDNALMDGVTTWGLTPVSQHAGDIQQWEALVIPNRHIVDSPQALSTSPPESMAEAHRMALAHYISHLPSLSQLGPASLSVETTAGSLALYRAQDIAPAAADTSDLSLASAQPMLSSFSEPPLSDAVSLSALAQWTTTAAPRTHFVPQAPRASHAIDAWARTLEEEEAVRRYELAVAAAERGATKRAGSKKSKSGGGAKRSADKARAGEAARFSVPLPVVPANESGSVRRRWRMVYSTDLPSQPRTVGSGDAKAATWPGTKELVVDIAVPLIQSGELIIGGDLEVQLMVHRQVALTVDTLDCDQSTALHTDLVLTLPVPADFSTFFAGSVMPTMVRAGERLFTPPSFTFDGREYTCKWIGRVASTVERPPNGGAAADAAATTVSAPFRQFVYGESNDGMPMTATRVVVPGVRDPVAWVGDRDTWRKVVELVDRA